VNISTIFIIVSAIFIVPIIIAIFSDSIRNSFLFTTKKSTPILSLDDNDSYYEKRAKQKVNLVLTGIFRMHTLVNHEEEFQDKKRLEEYKEYLGCTSTINFIKNVKGVGD